MKNRIVVTGGISGAITNPNSEQAIRHAEMYYGEIRKFTTDVQRIADNTGFTYDQILMVKNYLFVNQHNLDGEERYFDACFEIAESWRRLAFEKEAIKKHDLTLIKHELMEMELVSKGYSQFKAHDITNELFNYAKESDDYYKELLGCTDMEIKRDVNGGAVLRLNHNTH